MLIKDRLTIYNSLILPLFDYADIIWGDKNNSNLMDQLQILQNKAAKTILDAPLLSSSTEALSKLHWHPLTHRRFLHRMVTIFKLKYNLIECDFDLPKTTTCTTQDKEITFISANLILIGENRDFFITLARNTMIWTITLNQLKS